MGECMTKPASLLRGCILISLIFWSSPMGFYAQENRTKSPDSDYEERVNWALSQGKDIWGEEVMAKGGATFDNVKDYLRPLFYSTGNAVNEIAPHTLLFGLDGGDPPYVIPVSDGSRIYGESTRSQHYIDFYVGQNGDEKYGYILSKLEGPLLESGYYPILKTSYRDSTGLRYTQESFATPFPRSRVVSAYVKLTVNQNKTDQRTATLKIKIPVFDLLVNGKQLVSGEKVYLMFSGSPRLNWESRVIELTYSLDVSDGTDKSIYLVWFPQPGKYSESEINGESYALAKQSCKSYWDTKLQKGSAIEVPEPLVMHAKNNLLIQNLILRWRYGIGTAAYHRDWYPREGCDALTTLGLYGYTDEYKNGLLYMFSKPWREKEFGNSATQGEYLSHAAHYYILTRDESFLRDNTPTFEAYCTTMKDQIEKDPNGLLFKQRRTADIPTEGYWLNEQAVNWRGLRDIALAWKLSGRSGLYEKYRAIADKLRAALLKAIAASKTSLTDGSLF